VACPSRPTVHHQVIEMVAIARSSGTRKRKRMRNTFAVIVAASTLLAVSVEAQTAAPTAPPAAKPTLKQLGMVIYPSKGQTPDQQAKDEAACYSWAESQTGLTMGTGKVDTQAAAKAAGDANMQATQGAAVGGAAKGAVAGVAIGAIAGDAGKGAAIGAAAGAMGGRRARKQSAEAAASQGAASAQQDNAAMVSQFTKAAAVCLEGRGYGAK